MPSVLRGEAMPDVVKVRAATNNEVAFLAWDIDGMISGCLGFEIVRLYPDTGEERCLAAWVPFKGQRNPRWIPQDTGVCRCRRLSGATLQCAGAATASRSGPKAR